MVSDMNDRFASFETSNVQLANILKTVLDNQIAMKQELFLLRNNQAKQTTETSPEESSPSCPPPAPTGPVKKPYATPKPTKQPSGAKPISEFQSRTKVLYVSDSVGRTVEFPILEKEMKCTIKTAKAYSSVQDNNALWPARNFADVVKSKLDTVPADCLVLSAPTVDITNINTMDHKPTDSTDGFKKMMEVSCKNMFNIAHNAIANHPNLKKVIIMEHVPRHDTQEIDPLKMKAALARYANNVFGKLWLESKHKDKITVGQHCLDIDGAGHYEVYQNPENMKYDGVHFYGNIGRNIFTRSVMNLLSRTLLPEQPQQQADQSQQKSQQPPHPQAHPYHQKKNQSKPQDYHKKCPQFVFQQKQKQKPKQKQSQLNGNKMNTTFHNSVKDNNRFSVFNSNLGNM